MLICLCLYAYAYMLMLKLKLKLMVSWVCFHSSKEASHFHWLKWCSTYYSRCRGTMMCKPRADPFEVDTIISCHAISHQQRRPLLHSFCTTYYISHLLSRARCKLTKKTYLECQMCCVSKWDKGVLHSTRTHLSNRARARYIGILHLSWDATYYANILVLLEILKTCTPT